MSSVAVSVGGLAWSQGTVDRCFLLLSGSCSLQAQVLTLLLDVAAGMSYLHSRNVLHVSCVPCMQARSWQ